MPQIVASTYELMEQLGSGGGGVVYLGRHIRLDKQVVLKADKRTLAAKPEVLRREVDALKNLSHTYIPQVYDFIAENNTVYTVMDYIEGESLDKPLKRGERFSQPQVIEWACQLLEALCYLHSRPPHGILHSDIKPANIMLTPQNDIRLIDFNIALALGEEGAVRVGFSHGYASPEHYGSASPAPSPRLAGTELLHPGKEPLGSETELPDSISFSDFTETEETLSETVSEMLTYDRTEMQGRQAPETGGPAGVPEGRSRQPVDSGSAGSGGVLLDARSDIYSLGATLYHLLTGRRPAKDAREVEPITDVVGISPAVAAIIQKAMNPDPALRYQTAAEMLYAFEHLHENDPRTRRHRRRAAVTAAVLAAVFLASGAATILGLRQREQAEAEARQLAEAAEAEERANRAALAAVRTAEQAYQDGDMPGAAAAAAEALAVDSPYAAQAQKALTDALGVYDLSDGFHSRLALTLPSEPLKVALSPEGTRAATMTSGTLSVFDTETGELLSRLPADPSALADVVFDGEDTVLYAGDGALRAYDLTAERELWSGEAATGIALSADGSTVAAVYSDETYATVYDASTGSVVREVDFGGLRQTVATYDIFADPEDNLFALSGDGRWLAVSFDNGALMIYDLLDSENDIEIYDSSDYNYFEGGFCGNQLAFVSRNSSESVFVAIDPDRLEVLDSFAWELAIHTQADESGIYVAVGRTLVRFDPETGEETEVAYTDAAITAFQVGDTHTVTLTEDGALSFFDRAANLLETHTWEGGCNFAAAAGGYAVAASWDVPVLRVLALEDHKDSQLFSYDITYPHDEARLSADGKTVMLFSVDGFRLYSIDGELLAEESIPNATQLYDQQYRRDDSGSYLEVIYSDGLVRRYSAEDGSVLSEVRGERPDSPEYEEFYTARLRIASPMHGTPAAYDRETGELVRELEPNAYLTYVTEVGDYIITEYISAQEGERYGLLLNGNCETLARLPNLCDILADGTLVFDDMRGNLRQSRIYSLQELLAFTKNI